MMYLIVEFVVTVWLLL